MPSTWTQFYYHIVFSTKHREPLIAPDLQDRLHKFMGGVVRGLRCSPLEIGGMPDHLHMLVRMRADLDPSDLMRHVKARSSKWVHETFADGKRFGWQDGYGGFTVSASQVDRVGRYIRNQERHHKKTSFEDEFLELLRAHGVEFDERYVFD